MKITISNGKISGKYVLMAVVIYLIYPLAGLFLILQMGPIKGHTFEFFGYLMSIILLPYCVRELMIIPCKLSVSDNGIIITKRWLFFKWETTVNKENFVVKCEYFLNKTKITIRDNSKNCRLYANPLQGWEDTKQKELVTFLKSNDILVKD